MWNFISFKLYHHGKYFLNLRLVFRNQDKWFLNFVRRRWHPNLKKLLNYCKTFFLSIFFSKIFCSQNADGQRAWVAVPVPLLPPSPRPHPALIALCALPCRVRARVARAGGPLRAQAVQACADAAGDAPHGGRRRFGHGRRHNNGPDRVGAVRKQIFDEIFTILV